MGGDFTYAEVGIEADVPGGADQALVFLVGHVLPALFVPEALGEAEVDDEDGVKLLVQAHDEVLRLDVAVKVPSGVNEGDYVNLV